VSLDELDPRPLYVHFYAALDILVRKHIMNLVSELCLRLVAISPKALARLRMDLIVYRHAFSAILGDAMSSQFEV
jgi:hypothetical protein